MTKTFPLAQILSITTGRLMCDMGGVYEILNHITGDNLYTHVLPRAARFARPFIAEAFPELEAAWTAQNAARFQELLDCVPHHADQTPQTAISTWILWMMEPGQCGLKPEYEIQSHESAWLSLDPVSELEGMVVKERVMAVSVGDSPKQAVEAITQPPCPTPS